MGKIGKDGKFILRESNNLGAIFFAQQCVGLPNLPKVNLFRAVYKKPEPESGVKVSQATVWQVQKSANAGRYIRTNPTGKECVHL